MDSRHTLTKRLKGVRVFAVFRFHKTNRIGLGLLLFRRRLAQEAGNSKRLVRSEILEEDVNGDQLGMQKKTSDAIAVKT